MNVYIMGMVWNIKNLTSSEKLVLLAYADHASHDGTGIWPAVDTVSRKTSLSRRTVQRVTHDLEGKGYLVNDGNHDSGTNMWSIPADMGGDMVTPPGRHSDTGGVTLTTRGGDMVTPEPSLTINKPSNETIKKGGAGIFIFNLIGFSFEDADIKTKKAIEQLIVHYGEDKLCAYAEYLVEGQPEITLPTLLKRINNGIDLFVPTKVVADELAY